MHCTRNISYSLLFSYIVCVCVCACVTEYDHSGVLDTVDKICSRTDILMCRLSADQMGGTTLGTFRARSSSTSEHGLQFFSIEVC